MLLVSSEVRALGADLAVKTGVSCLKYVQTKFTDGESYFQLFPPSGCKTVSLIANITADPQSWVNFLGLAQAIEDNQLPFTNLIVPYLGYSRQDRITRPGEAVTAKIVTGFLNNLDVQNVWLFDLHSDFVRKMIKSYREIKVLPYLADQINLENYQVLVAPDEGSEAMVRQLAGDLPVLVFKKNRPGHNQVEHKFVGQIELAVGKQVLIVDDMIDTGGTIASAAQFLVSAGAQQVSVLATHPVFSPPVYKMLSCQAISRVVVSNTLPLGTPCYPLGTHSYKVKQVSIANLIEEQVTNL